MQPTKQDLVLALNEATEKMTKLTTELSKARKEIAELTESKAVADDVAVTTDHLRRVEETRHSDEMVLVLKRLDEIAAMVRK